MADTNSEWVFEAHTVQRWLGWTATVWLPGGDIEASAWRLTEQQALFAARAAWADELVEDIEVTTMARKVDPRWALRTLMVVAIVAAVLLLAFLL